MFTWAKQIKRFCSASPLLCFSPAGVIAAAAASQPRDGGIASRQRAGTRRSHGGEGGGDGIPWLGLMCTCWGAGPAGCEGGWPRAKGCTLPGLIPENPGVLPVWFGSTLEPRRAGIASPGWTRVLLHASPGKLWIPHPLEARRGLGAAWEGVGREDLPGQTIPGHLGCPQQPLREPGMPGRGDGGEEDGGELGKIRECWIDGKGREGNAVFWECCFVGMLVFGNAGCWEYWFWER